MKQITILDPDSFTDFKTISQSERIKISLLSSWRQLNNSWGIYSRNRLAVFGSVLLLVYILLGVIHPILLKTIWPKNIYDPVVGFDLKVFTNPSPPSAKHLLGTDTLGRDVLSMLMAATKPSLAMALTAALTAAVIGTLVGSLSAYFRGMVDGFFTHLSDLALLMPAPLLMVIIGFMLDIGPFKFGIIYGILVGIGVVAIVLRSHAMTVVNRVFIDAARVAGGGSLHIIFKHLIPHLIPLATVNMLLTVTGAIFANGFIAFLGLSRATLNWGSMIYDSFTYQGINGVIPWNVLIPSAMAISLFAASFYMIALGLQDVTNPRLAERFFTEISRQAREKKEKVEAIPSTTVFPKPSIQEFPTISTAKQAPGPGRSLDIGATTVFSSPRALPPLYQHWITVLMLSLNSGDSVPTDSSENLLSKINRALTNRGGLVKQFDNGLCVASFGLEKDIPPQASAWIAASFCLKVKQSLEEFNRQRVIKGLNSIKLSVGISLGQVELYLEENTNWYVPILATEVGQVARTLCTFAGFMRDGGVLICENTYDHLRAARHHFDFGRQGLAKLPPDNGQKMVYELTSHHSN